MVIPHLHFGGDCGEAIALYERAFGTAVEDIARRPDGSIAHAEMRIDGQLVYLNDRFGNKDKTTNQAVHLIVTFDTPDALRACCDVLSEGGEVVDAFVTTIYSALCGNFFDRFGVLWGFMAE